MTIRYYAVFWNDMPTLPYVMRHYQQFVDQFVIYDDGFTDGTIEYLEQFPNVETRLFVHKNRNSFLLSKKAVVDECWKESRGHADWVIVVDIDEFLYHPDFHLYLDRCR